MTAVCRVYGLTPEPAIDGKYLVAYDPDAEDGRGSIETTDDLRKARRFDDPAEIVRLRKIVSTVRPWLPDGQPNRPLLAFSLEIIKVRSRGR